MTLEFNPFENDGSLYLTNPEFDRRSCIRAGIKYAISQEVIDFDRYCPSRSKLRGANYNRGIRRTYSPETGVFDLVGGERPCLVLTLDHLTPFFSAGMQQVLGREERSVVCFVIAKNMNEFTVSDLADELYGVPESIVKENKRRATLGYDLLKTKGHHQNKISQTHRALLSMGVFIHVRSEGARKISHIKSPLLSVWLNARVFFHATPKADEMVEHYSNPEQILPFVLPLRGRGQISLGEEGRLIASPG